MDLERAMELLNNVIDHISATENTKSTVVKLFRLGFTSEELIRDFDFSEDDIEEAEEYQGKIKDVVVFEEDEDEY